MKLGLLVVVAVAVLLPGFSESRTVSKCELRDELRDKLKLSKKVEERTLATIICEVNRMSHLDTSLVNVFGDRIPTTPKPAVTTVPSTTGANTMTTAATLQPTSTNSTTQMTNTTTTATNTTTKTTTTTSATTTTANTTTTKNTTASMTTATSPATTNSTISSMNTTLVSNSTGGSKRQKREDDSRDETSSEEDTGYIVMPRSIGLYGLFQLSDKDFCDSGYRWSRNVCRTSCTAFTDDDITDDIACAFNTGYLGRIVENASNSCRRTSNFFKECN